VSILRLDVKPRFSWLGCSVLPTLDALNIIVTKSLLKIKNHKFMGKIQAPHFCIISGVIPFSLLLAGRCHLSQAHVPSEVRSSVVLSEFARPSTLGNLTHPSELSCCGGIKWVNVF
jgi:hypothetical protein